MMKKYLLKIPQILFLVLVLVIIGFNNGKLFNQEIRGNQQLTNNIPDSLITVAPHFPDCSFIRNGNEILVYNADGSFRASLLYTMPLCKEITGYGGNVPFVIVVSDKNTIEKLILLPNSETPNWIEALKSQGFFNTWNGLSVEESLNKKVDAITGSTFTTNAVIESMQLRLSEYSQTSKKKKEVNTTKTIISILSVLVIAFALFSFFFNSKLKKFRWILLVSEIIILGFIAGEFLSLAILNYTLINGINIYMRWVILVMLILSILLPLITNKSFYCQYLCPYGACQELVGKIPVKKLKIENTTSKLLKKLKYFYLLIIVSLILAGIPIVLEDFEPFMAFKLQFASWFSISIAILFLLLSVFFNKPWCKYFCPTGAFLEILRKPLDFLNSKQTQKNKNHEN
jgi:NosR/NirI family transcriptional regulator, nitrous oxide reductase regulator